MAIFKLTRRRLLISAAGATVVAGGAGLWLGIDKVRNKRFRKPVDRGDAFAPSVYLAIHADGTVDIWLTRSEMGQGVSTALPMLIAEELDADWGQVRVRQAVAGDGYDYGQLFTAASSSVTSQYVELRRAGACAREMLVAAAAARWGVAKAQCTTAGGAVSHASSGRRLGYGELADAAAAERVPIRPRLKDPSTFRLIGQPIPQRGIDVVVTGAAQYGLDVQPPGLLRAVVVRSPVLGGHPATIDDRAARAVSGVTDVFPVTAGVAVVASGSAAALAGRRALRVEWRQAGEPPPDTDSIAQALLEGLDAPDAGTARSQGDAAKALAGGEGVHTATYELPFLAHACMEPMNATAHVTTDECVLWVPTQDPHGAQRTAAELTGLPLDRVTVHTTLLGGGFGRRTAHDFVRDAVEVALRAGAPVQVLWTREDDLAHGEFREATAHRLHARLAADGRPEAWSHRICGAQSWAVDSGAVNMGGVMGAEDVPYQIEHLHVAWSGVRVQLPTRIWRSVGHSYNGFVVESFVDELAAAAGADPVAYRRVLLEGQPRLRRCLDRVAELSGWATAAADGRWLGVAANICMGSHVAQMLELTRAPDGGLRASKVWCMVDCGLVVHPDTAKAQIEGGILFGLGAALHGGMQIRDGRVVDDNFHRHRLLRMDEAPEIHVELVPSAEHPTGLGEASVPGAAPALANALFRATGQRVRRLPMAEVLKTSYIVPI
ncbi:MAG: molybdopterin-dependent oxidoreductase [Pseudomonadales bacterium]